MDLGLRGSRALITGGSKGIGLAIASSLAAEGAAVGLVARDGGGLATAGQQLGSFGVPVATASADVTDTDSLYRAVEDITAAPAGSVDLPADNRPTRLTRAGGAELAGSLPDALPEHPVHVALVGETAAGRDIRQRSAGAAEHQPGSLQPLL
jgi:NAD(P)-dependent dehydrogenase (short-subunit alcohol dehydrogenase family)